jgi:CheY-like chemotaxis protein
VEVGILIVDDDVDSQRALKNVLDSEGWRVHIVTVASQALAELATGNWNLAIVNVTLAEPNSALFAVLRELSLADIGAPAHGERTDGETIDGKTGDGEAGETRKKFRALFLVPRNAERDAQLVLEREGLPYSFTPYHLHDFLEKVSELLVEAGAIAEPIRSIGGFAARRPRPRELYTPDRAPGHSSRERGRGVMFASREDYQMTEEEMAEFERQEEEERKKREKERKDLERR